MKEFIIISIFLYDSISSIAISFLVEWYSVLYYVAVEYIKLGVSR
jgi:hypothetical protein